MNETPRARPSAEEAAQAQSQIMAELNQIAPHVGTRIDRDQGAFVRRCTRCQAESRKPFPLSADELRRDPSRMPPGFDQELFEWMRAFSVKHRDCPPPSPAAGA
jgi:hypothetical protein